MVSYIFGFMGKSTFQLDIICFKLQIALGAFYEHMQELQQWLRCFWHLSFLSLICISTWSLKSLFFSLQM